MKSKFLAFAASRLFYHGGRSECGTARTKGVVDGRGSVDSAKRIRRLRATGSSRVRDRRRLEGETLVAIRGDGSSPHTYENSQRKAYTARTFRIPSGEFAQRVKDNPTSDRRILAA